MTDELELDGDDNGWLKDLGLVDEGGAAPAEGSQGPSPEAVERLKAKMAKDAQEREAEQAVLVGALKKAWSADALKEFPLANVEDIALSGIEDEDKTKFLSEVKARHEAEEARLRAAGFVRLDADGKPVEPAPAVADADAAKAELIRQGWKPPIGGSDAAPVSEEAEVRKEVVDSMSRGPRAVIDVLMRRTNIEKSMTERHR